MRYLRRNEDFANLFKKYRLRSGIKTLIDFADILSKEKFIYDVSLFAKWQSGERVPRDRNLILKIIEVFVKEGGITSLDQANEILQAVQAPNLTLEESKLINPLLKTKQNKTLPPPPQLFIRSDAMLKARIWDVMNLKHILFYSMPGMGKTYLALYIANTLKRYFVDGVYWFHSDEISLSKIADTVLSGLGFQGYLYHKERKLEKLHEAIIGKTILIVLDNIDHADLGILSDLSNLNTAIIVTSTQKIKIDSFNQVEVPPFSQDEYDKICEAILGKAFYEIYEKQLREVGESVEFLPLTSSILIRHLHKKPISVLEYQTLCKKHKEDLKMLAYDNKNLYIAIHLLYKNLSSDEQDLLVTASLIEERIVSEKLILSLLKKRRVHIKEIFDTLLSLSLIELSSRGKYHLHSAVRTYLKSYISVSKYINLADYMVKNLEKISEKKRMLSLYIENNSKSLLTCIEMLIEFGSYENALTLYEKIRTYFTDINKLNKFVKLYEKLSKAIVGVQLKNTQIDFFISDIAPIYLLKNQYKELLNIFKSLKNSSNFDFNKSTLVEFSLLKGVVFFEKGMLYASKTAFYPLMKKGNLLAQAYMLLIALKRKDKVFYENYAEKIFKKNPYSSQDADKIFYVLGLIELELGKLEKAYSQFERAFFIAKKKARILIIFRSLEKLCNLSQLLKKEGSGHNHCLRFNEIDVLMRNKEINAI
jgi:hypothetical protein